MEFIIVGCGRVGAELAIRLFQKGHRVTVIDNTALAFQNLDPEFRGRTIEGEALNQDVLHRAGIEHVDGLAAVTNSDSLNAVVGHVAHTIYDIPNVIVRNYEPRWRSLYEAFDLQVVSSSSWGAQRVEELILNQATRTVFSAGNGEVEIYEVNLPDSWVGRRLKELIPDSDVIATALSRAGRAVLPTPETEFEEADILLVSATFAGIEEVRRRLHVAQEVS